MYSMGVMFIIFFFFNSKSKLDRANFVGMLISMPGGATDMFVNNVVYCMYTNGNGHYKIWAR